MELAKQFVDVGIFTNQIDQMRSFYGERIRLPYEEMLPVGGGVRQYRYGLLGSVLKINHSRDPLPPRIAGGYRMLSIPDPRTPMPIAMQDPDGNEIELVPTGQRGVNQIEIHLGVTDEAASIISMASDRCRAYRPGPLQARQYDYQLPARPRAVRGRAAAGARTDRVDARGRDALHHDPGARLRREHRASSRWACGKGGADDAGKVARISLIRDPDGNFIEISQRASLTGPIPD